MIEIYPEFPYGISGPDLKEHVVIQIRKHDIDLELSAMTGLTISDQ